MCRDSKNQPNYLNEGIRELLLTRVGDHEKENNSFSSLIFNLLSANIIFHTIERKSKFCVIKLFVVFVPHTNVMI